jgi:hypothetical protein
VSARTLRHKINTSDPTTTTSAPPIAAFSVNGSPSSSQPLTITSATLSLSIGATTATTDTGPSCSARK